ncbi:MAG: HAMP domain-containing histidine kinase, partial [Oscillospiraceae bacterium]|nr:HAMP domain-containing histidine kinase [Oscillospiraceae bacterium]
EKTTVSLSALSAEMSLLYSKVAENKGVHMDIVMEEGLWVLADEQEMRQILINLINNSIKAMPSGGCVAVTGSVTAGGVSITVEDNGPGMDEAQLERALQGGDGGQGLPIVQRLVTANGGTLSFDTAPGSGTRAILIFHGTGGVDHEV